MKKSKITIKITIASIEKSALQYITGGLAGSNAQVGATQMSPLYAGSKSNSLNPEHYYVEC
jgi:hypothetical protein